MILKIDCVSILFLSICHPERKRRVSEIIVEILRFAQNDMLHFFNKNLVGYI